MDSFVPRALRMPVIRQQFYVIDDVSAGVHVFFSNILKRLNDYVKHNYLIFYCMWGYMFRPS